MSAAVTAAAAAIFLLTYLVVAIGRAPGLRIDRAGAALVGGSLMLAVGAVPLNHLARAIDAPTLALLLLGLMIVTGTLRISGFFRLVNSWVVSRAHHPLQLLAAVILGAGIFSAFLLNDAICLVMTPLAIDIARRLRRDPVRYLLAVATASNIGSTATMTGNPQNILIGGFSGISYARFAATLSPVALVGLVQTFALIWVMHRGEFRRDNGFDARPAPAHLHRPLAARAILISLTMIAAFFAGAPPAVAALVAGGAMLVTRVVRSERIYREIDFPLGAAPGSLVDRCGLSFSPSPRRAGPPFGKGAQGQNFQKSARPRCDRICPTLMSSRLRRSIHSGSFGSLLLSC